MTKEAITDAFKRLKIEMDGTFTSNRRISEWWI